MTRTGTILMLALSASAAFGGVAFAGRGDVTCTNATLGAVSVHNVTVAAGASCWLAGTNVTGDVQVRDGGSLTTDAATTIRGDIHLEDDARLWATGTTIGKDVSCDHCASVSLKNATVGHDIHTNHASAGVSIIGCHVGHDVEVEHGTGGTYAINNNTVGHEVEFEHNMGASVIMGNNIDEELECKDNVPAPTGGNNTAEEIEGQCVGLHLACPCTDAPTGDVNFSFSKCPTAQGSLVLCDQSVNACYGATTDVTVCNACRQQYHLFCGQ